MIIFALLAGLLAAVGIYGVISYSVTQRTHEIGVRLALGAPPFDVLKMLLAQGIRLSLTGITGGILASLALTRVLSSMLYGVRAIDPLTFLLIPLLLMAVAFTCQLHSGPPCYQSRPVCGVALRLVQRLFLLAITFLTRSQSLGGFGFTAAPC